MRCGARFPAGARRWGEAGRGLRAPLPARAPLFHRSGCARSALGGRGGAGDVDGGLGGEWLGMGNEKGRCQKESEEEVAVLGKDALRPPFRPLGAGGCQEVAQMRGGCEGSPAEGPGDCSQAQAGSGQPPGTLQSPWLVAFWSPGRGCQGAGIGVLWEQGAARGRQGCVPPKSCVLRGEAATTPRGAPVCCGAGGPGGQVGSVGWAVLSLSPMVSQLGGVPRSWHTARPLLLLGSCR